MLIVISALAISCTAGRALSEGDRLNPTRSSQQWEYLDNGQVRIGVDRSRGACIGFFGESRTKRNLLNHYDEGRFIQQSYYGAPDGSMWNGKPWVYNPVQGGSWKGQASRLLEFSRNPSGQTLFAKVQPLRWSSGLDCPEVTMDELISLEGPVARIRFRMKYAGQDQSVIKDQEMPAVFADAKLSRLICAGSGKLVRRIPGWPNERGASSEDWVAYVDEKDWGLGIYTPGTSRFTCYRYEGNGTSGPRGSACSYVAPIRQFSLQKGLDVGYDVYLTVGSVKEIQSRFSSLQKKRATRRTTQSTVEESPEHRRAKRLFAVKIHPLLKSRCLTCHGLDQKKLKGELDLRSLAGLLKGGESGQPAIVAGKPGKSPLYLAVTRKHRDVWPAMPPKENDKLSAQQVSLIRDWIAGGAPWPDKKTIAILLQQHRAANRAGGVQVSTSGGLDNVWTTRRYRLEDIWAFQAVRSQQLVRRDISTVTGESVNPIDDFILARLHDSGLAPARQAEPRTLIRRATYDLLGLPPTPEQINLFLLAWKADPDSAWTALVDRLLAHPHYGEAWGQHWLDVVRYADTSGFSNDWERSNAWRYRDYVVRSFNDDKPYDQFIEEQIAGDELLQQAQHGRQGPPTAAESEWLIAAGFLRMGPWEHTAMSPDKVSRQLFLDDLVNSIGQTFLSTALRCCRCHDHKFDPIPTRDYYRIYAAVATTQLAERPAAFLTEENRNGFAANRRHADELLEFASSQRNALYAKREAAARKWYAERGREKDYVNFNQRRRLPAGNKPPRFIGLTSAEQGTLKVWEQDTRIWTRRQERFLPLAQSVYAGGDLYQKSIRLRMPDAEKTWEVKRSQQLPQSFIYGGGNVFSLTHRVTPGVLSGLGIEVARRGGGRRPQKDAPGNVYDLPRQMRGRRLALAGWIADARNPLTTRSIVNRVWHYHFGRGIAANPNNLGTTGKKPTHPGLLDWLAGDFAARGWSIKRLHRLIMASATYRRSSHHPDIESVRQRDPNNKLLAVFRPRRLTAEELRETMLSVSGELNPELGGLPICPEINQEVALAPRMLQGSLAPAWQPSRTPGERHRRSIYAYHVRGLADPLLDVFNKPGSDQSCELRDADNVTPQVFALMNSRAVTSRSLAMALRLESEAAAPRAQIQRGYQLAIGRPLNGRLLESLVTHYQAMVAYHHRHTPERVLYPTRITRSLVEELSGTPFEYHERLDIYEDYLPDTQAADVAAKTRALADICLLLFNSNAFIYIY